jgi:hypothetical protein
MNGQLFTQDFLDEGIKTTPPWENFPDADLDAFINRLHEIYAPFRSDSKLNEAGTEQEIIVKVLAALGWSDLLLPQNTASGTRREDVPDWLLFSDSNAKTAALRERKEDRRYRHGIAILEAKRWMRALDRGEATDRLDPGTPSNQILRYLSSAEVASERKVRWGILTNGQHWRLYYQGARSRSEEFLELDLGALLGLPGLERDLSDEFDTSHGLKLFFCFFHRAAFLPQSWDEQGRSFHEIALAEALLYEEKVSQDLGARVFATVFPDLANALAAYDPAAKRPYTRSYLDQVREAALILLYRLLFVLYAEDRLLLPVRDKRYFDYSLRKLRQEVREKCDANAVFSAGATRFWDALQNLFGAIAAGDSALGLPAYNGGLFEDVRTPLLTRARIPDSKLAPLIDELSRRADDVLKAWINYRDLSVQHLGSIYERLLEFRLEREGEKLAARPASFARRTSGSFYTHEDLVQLIIEQTVGPLVRERLSRFSAQLTEWKNRRELKPADWEHLDALDPASKILELRVCDPAMGSGHFLVSLVDYLADVILEAVDDSADAVSRQAWARNVKNVWRSPLIDRIEEVRGRILEAAGMHGWAVDAIQLDDRHIVRRMILKRVIHGVDKNPMAVELAKVALWLHTFTVGAPLSFLDHHLRCGDSLHGERPETVTADMQRLGVVFQQGEFSRVEAATSSMEKIAELTDVDVAEVHQSRRLLEQTDLELAPLNALLDLWRSLRWLNPGWPRVRQMEDRGVAELLSGRHDLMQVMQTGRLAEEGRDIDAANRLLEKARDLAAREHFLHWQTAFPAIWSDRARRGFDAVIGNPPWDRIKLQEVEWFAERKPEIARAARASDRKRMIEALKENEDPLWREYELAKDTAEIAARVFRECADYPLLSTGDMNLYCLFVERAQSLIHPRGMVGLLTPSGIAADKSAADFFRTLATPSPFAGEDEGARLAALFDFENRNNPGGSYFPDVDSRFKFCTLVFGGEKRAFAQSSCAFYLHDVVELAEPNRVLALTTSDFQATNPNTGGAPIFRTKRDAEITTAIYRRQPVFVDRRSNPPKKVWPVRYVRMFDMTNDSRLFMRRDELEKKGWYPVEHNRYKKGEAMALPLYEGKMVQMYDHRAANVVVHADNVHRPAQQKAVSLAHHQDPKFSPQPQFWVEKSDVDSGLQGNWAIAFKDVTAPSNVRTMIASIVPHAGYGNTLPILPANDEETASSSFAPLLLGNLNAFVLIT